METNIASSKKVFFACDTNSDSFNPIKDALNAICQELSLELYTYENVKSTLGNDVLSKINQIIQSSLLVIADIGSSNVKYGNNSTNPNVALEIGLASANKIPTLLIANKQNEKSIITNLKGQDFVLFPECVQIGNVEATRLKNAIIKTYNNSIIANPVKIYNTKSKIYLDTLSKIFTLPGDIFFVSPELRSFIRPIEVRIRWLKEVRKYEDKEIEKEMLNRDFRFSQWKEKLNNYKCIDIYPYNVLRWENYSWRGLKLNKDEKKAYYKNAINLLEEFPNYEIAILPESEKSFIKFWIKSNDYKPFVMFDGYGYVEIRKNMHLGGIIFSDKNVAKTFEDEFSRLYSICTLQKKSKVIDSLNTAIKNT